VGGEGVGGEGVGGEGVGEGVGGGAVSTATERSSGKCYHSLFISLSNHSYK